MKRSLVMLGYGLGGIAVALVLSLGAFALAGRQIGEPATPVRPAFSLSASPFPSAEPTQTRSPEASPAETETPRATSSPSHDDSGSGGDSGSDDQPSGGHHSGDD
jgi:hypothetical protein